MRTRIAAGLLALMTTATLGCTVAACGAAAVPTDRAVQVGSVAASAPSGTPGTGNPATAEVAVVQEAIDRFNAAAGGSVAAQQSVLSGLVSPAQAAEQHACPPVTVTISMQPVYARLAASPGWRPSSGTLPGTIYAVPTLIRIYSGDRITGTDLTDLHLAIDDGRMTLPAVCLR